MASLKYKLSHVSQGIGMLICLQLRVDMKGITGRADSRRSCNAPWSAASSQYFLGRLLDGACFHGQVQPSISQQHKWDPEQALAPGCDQEIRYQQCWWYVFMLAAQEQAISDLVGSLLIQV